MQNPPAPASLNDIDIRFLGCVDYLPTYEAMQVFTAERVGSLGSEISLRANTNMRNQLWICEHLPVFTQGLAGKPEHLLLPGDIPVVQTNRGGQVTYHGPGQVVAYPLIDLKRAGYFVKEYVFKIEESVIKTLLHFGVTGHRIKGAPGIYVRTDDPASHARLELTEADLKLANPEPMQKIAKQIGSDPIYLDVSNAQLEPTKVDLRLSSATEKGIKRGLTPFNSPFNPSASALPHIGKIAALGIKVSRHCTYHGVALNVAMDLEPFSRINPCGYAGLRTVDMASLGVKAGWDAVAQVFASKLQAYLMP